MKKHYPHNARIRVSHSPAEMARFVALGTAPGDPRIADLTTRIGDWFVRFNKVWKERRR